MLTQDTIDACLCESIDWIQCSDVRVQGPFAPDLLFLNLKEYSRHAHHRSWQSAVGRPKTLEAGSGNAEQDRSALQFHFTCLLLCGGLAFSQDVDGGERQGMPECTCVRKYTLRNSKNRVDSLVHANHRDDRRLRQYVPSFCNCNHWRLKLRLSRGVL